MLDVYDIYLNCQDEINPDERGYFKVEEYNRWSWIAQLRALDWLSGDVSGITPPEAFNTQKNRDWLSDFINKYERNIEGGLIVKPSDYYLYQSMVVMNASYDSGEDEDTEDKKEHKDIIVKLLDAGTFHDRANTAIRRLKPSVQKPICKIIGKNFEFYPKDIGSVRLEYVRYPKKSNLVMKEDLVHMDEVYDLAASTQFEWGEYARTLLVWFIVDGFHNRNRDTLGKQMNQASPKLSRQP